MNGESQLASTSNQVRAGTTKVMTHSQRQAFWENSSLGKALGFFIRMNKIKSSGGGMLALSKILVISSKPL